VSGAAGEARQLESGAAALGVDLDAGSVALLLAFLERLYAWNRSAGLTTIARSEAVRLHLIDSVSVVRFLPRVGVVADLGSGGGLPGIPIAIARKDLTVTLVESRRRKATFLSEAVRELGIGNCTVEHADARRLASRGCAYDAITARAFLPPAELVALGASLLTPRGRLILMGARGDLDNATTHPDLVRVADERFVLPGGDEQRRIVVLERTAPL
jgi:16S rRNA (guanine527-N7)-methyltransferase